MYFPNMSNLHLLLVSSMKTSKLIQFLPLKPTMDISDVCEEEEEEGDMNGHREVGRCHSPSSSSSSSSSSAKDVVVLSKINREDNSAKQALIHSEDGNDGEGDDGYQTPTSPGRKIQATVVCPSAPKKPLPRRQTRKRKADHELINIRDVQLLFCADRRAKKIKPRREDSL